MCGIVGVLAKQAVNQDLYDALTVGKADAALVASMVHYGEHRVSELKHYLHNRGLKMRMSW